MPSDARGYCPGRPDGLPLIHVRDLSDSMRYRTQRKTMMTRRALLFVLVFLSTAVHFVRAEDDVDDDHDEARRAVEQGQARPLAELLDRIQPRLGGKVIGVELEREQGRYIYELKVVTSGGALREIYVDAITGEMLKSEGE